MCMVLDHWNPTKKSWCRYVTHKNEADRFIQSKSKSISNVKIQKQRQYNFHTHCTTGGTDYSPIFATRNLTHSFFPYIFQFLPPNQNHIINFFFPHFIHSFLARIPTSPPPPSPDGYFPFCPFKLRTKKMVSNFHHTLRALFLFVFRFFLCCSSSLWIFIKQKISNLIAVHNQNRWLICSFHKKKSF